MVFWALYIYIYLDLDLDLHLDLDLYLNLHLYLYRWSFAALTSTGGQSHSESRGLQSHSNSILHHLPKKAPMVQSPFRKLRAHTTGPWENHWTQEANLTTSSVGVTADEARSGSLPTIGQARAGGGDCRCFFGWELISWGFPRNILDSL